MIHASSSKLLTSGDDCGEDDCVLKLIKDFLVFIQLCSSSNSNYCFVAARKQFASLIYFLNSFFIKTKNSVK